MFLNNPITPTTCTSSKVITIRGFLQVHVYIHIPIYRFSCVINTHQSFNSVTSHITHITLVCVSSKSPQERQTDRQTTTTPNNNTPQTMKIHMIVHDITTTLVLHVHLLTTFTRGTYSFCVLHNQTHITSTSSSSNA